EGQAVHPLEAAVRAAARPRHDAAARGEEVVGRNSPRAPMAELTIYHNPRCSKSRAALELVREAGVEPRVVEYLKTPPTADELDPILNALGVPPRDLMRKGEKEYAELKLDSPGLSRAQLIRAMVEHPILIERPIAVKGKKAVVGRPPENLKALL